MSINTCVIPELGGIILYNGERILIFYNGCELRLKHASNNPFMSGVKKGKIFLTSHRVIFMSTEKGNSFKSFSMPFSKMKGVDIKQPVFGANKIEGVIHAEANGGYEGSAEFSFTFNHGGAIEFGSALLELGKRTSQNRGMPPPPPYNYQGCTAYPVQGVPMGAQSYYAAPPPAYASPYQDSYYNFVPQHESFATPPANMVYMYPTPPPYPGAYNPPPYQPAAPTYNGAPYPPMNGAGYAGASQPPPYQPAQNDYNTENMTPTERAKAAEANLSYNNGYYDPHNPHTVYSPPPPAYNSIQRDSTPSAPMAGYDNKPPPYNPDYKKSD